MVRLLLETWEASKWFHVSQIKFYTGTHTHTHTHRPCAYGPWKWYAFASGTTCHIWMLRRYHRLNVSYRMFWNVLRNNARSIQERKIKRVYCSLYPWMWPHIFCTFLNAWTYVLRTCKKHEMHCNVIKLPVEVDINQQIIFHFNFEFFPDLHFQIFQFFISRLFASEEVRDNYIAGNINDQSKHTEQDEIKYSNKWWRAISERCANVLRFAANEFVCISFELRIYFEKNNYAGSVKKVYYILRA